jgi:predicted AlkP superfamily phosphohydrolase/phosphomutase
MLSNSLVAALLATSYVLVLVLQLNPSIGLSLSRLVSLVTTIGLFYAVHLTVIFYILLVIRQILATEVFSPAWVSVGVLVWLGAAAAAAGAALMWGNLQTFTLVLEPATREEMASGALALLVASALFVCVALVRAQFGPRARAWCALLIVAIAAGSIGVPLALRGRGEPPLLATHPIDLAADLGAAERAARVTILAIDAGSLDFITSATTDGRLPNFGRILDAGAVMHLATLHPTSAESVWTAVATGKWPQKNGVRSAGDYRLAGGGEPIQLLPDYCFAHSMMRLGFLVEEPHSSATLRTRPLWSILSTLGIPVGVVGWPLTDPAPKVRGFLVSDSFHRLASTPLADESTAVYPPEAQADAVSALEDAAADRTEVLPASTLEVRFETPGRTDRAYDRIAQALARTRPAQVMIVRYQSLDPIGHYFLRYAMPSQFGDVTDEERRRFGSVLERHYSMIDEAIGRAIAALGPDDLLLVVSGYGIEPLGFGKRVIERLIGDPDVSGTHEAAPDGFLMAYGAPVARARLLNRAAIVDVAPTVLYFLGLPIGRDMDGYARTDLFQRSFTDERPITFIPTYDR